MVLEAKDYKLIGFVRHQFNVSRMKFNISFANLNWQAEGTSAESIAALARIDTVKRRMEAAYATLQVWFFPFIVFIWFRWVWKCNILIFYLNIKISALHFYNFVWNEQDAAGLTQLSASVEDVFASGDLPRAAETLATMRHCLSAVGEVLSCSSSDNLMKNVNFWDIFVKKKLNFSGCRVC